MIHFQKMPRRDGQRPTVGERLTFEIEIDKAGKKRARNLLCPGRTIIRTPRQREPRSRREKPSFLRLIVSFSVVVALAVYGYGKYSHRFTAVLSNEETMSSAFQCDGRIYCSQMTSSDEATFFLRNCPNVKMDGNHDGVPCEQQWCSQ